MTDEIIFSQVGFPVFQNKVYRTKEAARNAVCGDVELVQCVDSGLVFNRTFDPELLNYDTDYQNEQAHSPAFKQHLANVMKIILRNFGPEKTGVEIGCGKGYFFELVSDAGARLTGYDPAFEGNNPKITKEYFCWDKIANKPDYFILRHVLEHIASPWQFLAQLAAQCRPGTKIFIEVPCFDWIVSNNAYYDIFYEHVNYFTADVLAGAFESKFESGHFFGGQYLYLIADLSTFRPPERYAGKRFHKIEMKDYITSLLRKRTTASGKTFIWGAGAKGITFANMLSEHSLSIEALIDMNPAKQGRFAALSGLPIVAPAEIFAKLENADVFVMNPVYLDEIKSLVDKINVNLVSVA